MSSLNQNIYAEGTRSHYFCLTSLIKKPALNVAREKLIQDFSLNYKFMAASPFPVSWAPTACPPLLAGLYSRVQRE